MARRELADLHRKLSTKTPTSDLMHSSSRELLAAVAVGTLNLLHPIYIRTAKGSRVIDVDGNEYIDLVMGFSPHILGHAPDVAIAALQDAAVRGFQWALHSPYVEPLAQLVADAYPSNEMVVFCNSGTEATMHSVRVARAFTRKSKIAVFEGGYHGNHDYVMVGAIQASPKDAPEFAPRGHGIPREVLSTVMMLPYWNDAAFDQIRDKRDELAAVIVEPVQGLNPQTKQGAWLKALRDVCSDCDVLLIFDEVITGFRLGYGGGQQLFGVPADLVTYGKVIGGGLPCGAIAGRRDIMELYRPRADGTTVYTAGTFNANPITTATGVAVLSHLRAHPEAYDYLRRQSSRMASELNQYFVDNGLHFQIQHADSILFLRFRPPSSMRTAREAALDPSLNEACDAFHLKLFDRGVISPRDHQFFLSTAHTERDVDEVIAAFREALFEVQAEGYMEAIN